MMNSDPWDMGKKYHVNMNQKKVEVSISVSITVDFRAKNKEKHFIMIKDSIHEGCRTMKYLHT